MKRRGRTPAKPPARRPGRPHLHAEQWTKVSVVLFTRQVDQLDALADTIRRQGHRSINRASLIRAVIDGVLSSRVNLSSHATEAHVRDDIANRLNTRARTL